ncbi:hypothetical protein AVEN_126067-1, partial [Araneus ventricosus]
MGWRRTEYTLNPLVINSVIEEGFLMGEERLGSRCLSGSRAWM